MEITKEDIIDNSESFLFNINNMMNGGVLGYSLKKWLAVIITIILGIVEIKYTDKDNLVAVATVDSGLISALIITSAVQQVSEHKS